MEAAAGVRPARADRHRRGGRRRPLHVGDHELQPGDHCGRSRCRRQPRCTGSGGPPRPRGRRRRTSRALPHEARRSRLRRHRGRRRAVGRSRHHSPSQPGGPSQGWRAGQGPICQGLRWRRRHHPRQPEHRHDRRARGRSRLHQRIRRRGHRLPHELRRLSEHAGARRDPGHERGRFRDRAPLPDAVNEPAGDRSLRALARVPVLVIACSWSAALAAAVVLVPSQSWIGAVAVALAIPCLALAVAMAGQTATIVGRVADDSRAATGGSEVIVEPDVILVGDSPVSNVGNLMVRWRGPEEAGFGDQINATGKLVLPLDLPSFDRRAYLAQRHAYLQLDTTGIDVTSSPGGLTALPTWLRTRYAAALDAALPAPHAAVLLGVVLGIRQGIPPELQQALIATGLIHLLVLSGLKVAVFARIVQGALRPILRRYAAWPALCLIGLYALAGGATPAAIRAAVMGGMAIAAASLGRPSHVWTSLAATAAAMLAWRPELAWDVGFQLSFAGTTAIILLTPWIERRLRLIPHVLREPFAVTCAAQIGTLPMMATDFHVLSPVAPIANALVLPILPAVVVAGLALGPLSLFPDVARVAAIPLAGLLGYLEQVAYVLGRFPAAAIPVVRFPPWTG